MAIDTRVINSPIDIQLPYKPNVSDQELFEEASRIYNALRQLQIFSTKYSGQQEYDSGMWSALQFSDTIVTNGMNRIYARATENIPLGNFVNLHDTGTELGVRRANASSGTPRQAMGILSSPLAGAISGEMCEIKWLSGMTNLVTGLTRGTMYYLATTAGLITSAKPAGPNLQQPIGVGLAADTLFFLPGYL